MRDVGKQEYGPFRGSRYCGGDARSGGRKERGKVRDVPREVPCLQPLGAVALALRPLVTVREGAEVRKVPDGEDHDRASDLEAHTRAERRRHEVKDTAHKEDAKVEGREVVV